VLFTVTNDLLRKTNRNRMIPYHHHEHPRSNRTFRDALFLFWPPPEVHILRVLPKNPRARLLAPSICSSHSDVTILSFFSCYQSFLQLQTQRSRLLRTKPNNYHLCPEARRLPPRLSHFLSWPTLIACRSPFKSHHVARDRKSENIKTSFLICSIDKNFWLGLLSARFSCGLAVVHRRLTYLRSAVILV
jgi:hypothetical protein